MRVSRFELVPLEDLEGRPRVDVLCNMSGIFRDSFQNVVELLDDLFQRAAEADEPEHLNFIRHAAPTSIICKHTCEPAQGGDEQLLLYKRAAQQCVHPCRIVL